MISDPRIRGLGDTPVASTTPQKIREYADAIFGVANTAAKQVWETRALFNSKQGKPIYVDSNVASADRWGTALVVGGALILGAVFFFKKSKGGRRRR